MSVLNTMKHADGQVPEGAKAAEAHAEQVPVMRDDQPGAKHVTDIQTTDTKTTALQYRDRAWSEVEFDFPWKEVLSPSEAAYNNGWQRIQTLGDEDSLSVDVYERQESASEGPRYFAFYSLSDSWEFVILPRLQDLIDFLAHVSTTMLVAILPSDAWTILNDLCNKTPSRMEERKRECERLTKLKSERAVAQQANGSKE